jgi:hypothetical protein
MRNFGRLLQKAALVIPVLALLAQLNENITAGKMLSFLFVSVVIFSIGYLLQRYSGDGS